MSQLIAGQLSIFDVLEPEKPATFPPAKSTAPSLHQPLTVEGNYCPWCGTEFTGNFDQRNNHHVRGWQTGTRMCLAMELTQNHVLYQISQLRNAAEGNQADQCCWDKYGLHGKAIRKPTVEQLADHLRWQLAKTRKTWGIRAEVFDDWAVSILIDNGLLEHTYYWARFDRPGNWANAPVRLPFTVTTGAGMYDENFCAYCGGNKRLNEGGSGPATADHPAYRYNICEPCREKYSHRRPPSELWTYKELS